MATQPATATITLTPGEARLKGLLLDVAKSIEDSSPQSEPVILRWAGGWVRDKLLGIESHDIDVAINVMTGEGFGLKLKPYAEQPESMEKHNISESDIGNLHHIAANPEKSKHLATTTIKIFGYDVDIVNLRKETYTADSRNPQMEFGTAEEDALRRDATINALFYNLNTDKVEDFTTGLQDMDAKLIRTPMEPFQTFMDDPLRVLRLVRFASRLQFQIEEDTRIAMRDSRVLEALDLKISRERVGQEVEKMLKGNHPRDSLECIDQIGLYHNIFTDPSKTPHFVPDISDWGQAYRCLDSLSRNRTQGSIYDLLVRTDEDAYFAWVLAAISPWVRAPPQVAEVKAEAPPKAKSKAKGKAKEAPKAKPAPPLATMAAREGIKATSKLCDIITAAHANLDRITELKNAVRDGKACIGERDTFGMAIREWDKRAGAWRLQVLYAVLVEVLKLPSSSSSSTKDDATATEEEEEVLRGWQKFLDHIFHTLKVGDAPETKHIIDGNQLKNALGVKVKPGQWMMKALDVVMAWQLRNPGLEDKALAVDEVDSRREELEIPPRSQ